jgi:hypothetical protein
LRPNLRALFPMIFLALPFPTWFSSFIARLCISTLRFFFPFDYVKCVRHLLFLSLLLFLSGSLFIFSLLINSSFSIFPILLLRSTKSPYSSLSFIGVLKFSFTLSGVTKGDELSFLILSSYLASLLLSLDFTY